MKINPPRRFELNGQSASLLSIDADLCPVILMDGPNQHPEKLDNLADDKTKAHPVSQVIEEDDIANLAKAHPELAPYLRECGLLS